MASASLVRCLVLDTGYCLASESHMMQGGERRTVECHALVALLEHPVHGWTLWDTGYAPRLLQATTRWPYRLYRLATPLRLDPTLAVAAQLPRLGLQGGDVRRVVLSHLHADHIAGLRDFPTAEWICTQAAYEAVAGRRGLSALRRAFIPALLPDDFATRATLLPQFSRPSLPGLGPTHDLLGDGTLRLVALPGHARGQVGLLAQTTDGPKLFCADGAYTTRSIRERRPPARLTSFYVDDWRAVHTTLDGLAAFAAACPEVALVPTHCPEALARETATNRDRSA
ncbi:MAG: MBL fold metallo-hydrolase [Anaerolineae bacterium]|nr:MBL fold metallo-hydrolase [Anaerolineae bacterium]